MKRVVINKSNLLHNLETVRGVAGREVIAVIKGNGYGLGGVQLARVLRDAGVRILAVSNVEEAEELRDSGDTGDILVLSSCASASEAEKLLELDAIATVGSYESAVLLSGMAVQRGVTARAHIKVDTGFGHFGFAAGDTDKAAQVIKYMNGLKIIGIYTHPSSAFGKKEITAEQYRRFKAFCDELAGQSLMFGTAHFSNSCAALRFPEYAMNAVRVGSALTGRLPIRNKWDLQPVSCLQCGVLDVRWLPKGHNIGYGNITKTKRPTRIAVVPVGYSDGVFVCKAHDAFRFIDVMRYIWHDVKLLFGAGRLSCTIGGRRVKVIGRVNQCNMVLDVTDVDCSPGDVVEFNVNPLFINPSIERIYE